MKIINNPMNVKCIIHTGDWHLKSNEFSIFQKNVDNFLLNVLNSIEGKYTPKECVFILAGDLFDNHNKTHDFDTLLCGAKALHKIMQLGFHLIVTAGNHDYDKHNVQKTDYLTPIYELYTQFGRLAVETICAERFIVRTFVYMKHSGYYVTENIVFVNYSILDGDKIDGLEEIKKIHEDKLFIGLFHGCLKNAQNFQGYDLADNHSGWVEPSNFEGCDAVIMADIHRHQLIPNEQNIPMVYCGSPWQLNFGESVSEHYFVLWEIDEDSNIYYEKHQNKGLAEKHKFIYRGDNNFEQINK